MLIRHRDFWKKNRGNAISRAIASAHRRGDKKRLRNFFNNRRLHFGHKQYLEEHARIGAGEIWQQIAAGGIGGVMLATAGSPILVSNIARSGVLNFTGKAGLKAIGSSYVTNGEYYYNDEQWHHLAYVVSDTGNTLYIDGTEVAMDYVVGTASTTGYFMNMHPGALNMALGRRFYPGSSLNFNGSLDEFNIWSRALDADEIRALANGTRPGEVVDLQTPNAVNRFRYGNSERIEELSFQDFSSRMYDSEIGRWNKVDPVSESYFTYSPLTRGYGSVTNKAFFEKFGGDHNRLRAYKEGLKNGGGKTYNQSDYSDGEWINLLQKLGFTF